MTTIQAIESLGELRLAISQRYLAVQLESERIEQEWAGLGKAGGQREDHAASLLARLTPVISDLSEYAHRVEKQIDAWNADPFGEST
ncbi:MAG: hypothetical protein ABSG53_05690 [Thermoguttaceae bacterium]|jgi:hypothetical protein